MGSEWGQSPFFGLGRKCCGLRQEALWLHFRGEFGSTSGGDFSSTFDGDFRSSPPVISAPLPLSFQLLSRGHFASSFGAFSALLPC
jgi:hypothetical protein